MVPPYQDALIVHDSFTVIDVSDALCRLFRCEREDLLDRSLAGLLASDDFGGLAKLRLRLLRESGSVPPVRYPFRRPDRTCFWALVTTAVRKDGLYNSTVLYEFEEPCL